MNPKQETGKNSNFIERLKRIRPLDRFSDADLASVVDMSQVIQYDAGDTIIRQDELDNRIYFLIAGEVRVEKDGQTVKNLWETGSVFGEMGVIEGVSRSATVTAQKKSVCLSLDATFFDRLRDQGGQSILERIFTEVLADRLRSTTEELSRCHRELAVAQHDNNKLRSLVANLKKLTSTATQLVDAAEPSLHHRLPTASPQSSE